MNDHEKIVNDWLIKSNKTDYMLTIARDGEHPDRSIYFFQTALEAVTAYNRYVDWGFAKEFLTVILHEPNGTIHKKVLRRPPAGECSYVKKNYVDMVQLLLSIKDKVDEDLYHFIVNEICKIFSQDNIRFNPQRFIEETNSKELYE